MLKPFEIFRDVICGGNYKTVGDDVDYKCVMIDKTPYLVFQGSTSKEDWKNNFTFWRKLYKNQESCMLVHAGFGKAWKSANDVIMAEFIELCKKSVKPPVICGHSFGGAMSVLAAEDFIYRTGKKTVVITFGAPKVLCGKKSVKHILNCGSFIQYAQRNDCVPLCPPLLGYRQVNKVKIGGKFNFIGLFRPQIYHQLYGKEEEYKK